MSQSQPGGFSILMRAASLGARNPSALDRQIFRLNIFLQRFPYNTISHPVLLKQYWNNSDIAIAKEAVSLAPSCRYRKSGWLWTPGWLWTCYRNNVMSIMLVYLFSFSKIFLNILIGQCMNIINDYEFFAYFVTVHAFLCLLLKDTKNTLLK